MWQENRGAIETIWQPAGQERHPFRSTGKVIAPLLFTPDESDSTVDTCAVIKSASNYTAELSSCFPGKSRFTIVANLFE